MKCGRAFQRISHTQGVVFQRQHWATLWPLLRGGEPRRSSKMQRYRSHRRGGEVKRNPRCVCPPRRCRQKGSATFAWSAPPPLPEGGAKAFCCLVVVQSYPGQRRSMT